MVVAHADAAPRLEHAEKPVPTTTSDPLAAVALAQAGVKRVLAFLESGDLHLSQPAVKQLAEFCAMMDRPACDGLSTPADGVWRHSAAVTEDEENTTIAALLLDDDDEEEQHNSEGQHLVVEASFGRRRRHRRRKTAKREEDEALSDGVVTPVPAADEPSAAAKLGEHQSRCPKRAKRACGRFSEDEFAVQIKQMCAVSSEDDGILTREAKRRRGRGDDPMPKCQPVHPDPLTVEEASTDEEDVGLACRGDERQASEQDQPLEEAPDEPPTSETQLTPQKPRLAAFGRLGTLPTEVALAILSKLNGAELGRLECSCRAARGTPGLVEFAVLHVKRHQYGVTELPLLKRETYPRLVCRWEWTRSSKSVSTRTDEVAAALQSLDIYNANPQAQHHTPEHG